MNRVKLLANENFPYPGVRLLRNLGYDVIAIGEKYPGVSDKYVMNLAELEQRLIITFDRDYGELIYKHDFRPAKGVIYLRLKNFSPEEPGSIIDRLLQEYSIETDRMFTVFDGKIVRQRKY